MNFNINNNHPELTISIETGYKADLTKLPRISQSTLMDFRRLSNQPSPRKISDIQGEIDVYLMKKAAHEEVEKSHKKEYTPVPKAWYISFMIGAFALVILGIGVLASPISLGFPIVATAVAIALFMAAYLGHKIHAAMVRNRIPICPEAVTDALKEKNQAYNQMVAEVKENFEFLRRIFTGPATTSVINSLNTLMNNGQIARKGTIEKMQTSINELTAAKEYFTLFPSRPLPRWM